MDINKENRVYRIVITNVPINKQMDVIEVLALLVKKGIIDTSNVHWMEEDWRYDT